MAGHHPSLSAQLAADRHARFAAEAAGAQVRRLLRRPHPAPRCAGLAGQLPAVGVDLRPPLAGARRPARRLKAANALRLLDERPEITHVDTWNARSNAHMVAINQAMGFEVIRRTSTWQASTAAVVAALAPRQPL